MHRRVDAAFAAFDLADKASYAHSLMAHARVVPALERALGDSAAWSGWSPRTDLLKSDLAELGYAMPATNTTPALCATAAWGVQYVLEGSKLGGQFLARQVGVGLPRRYLSAGFERGGWRRFQAELDAAATHGGARWTAEAIEAARSAFLHFETAARGELGLAT